MDKEYKAFLVRFTRKPHAMNWRATLEDAHTTNVHHFATEAELLRYLECQLRIRIAADDASDDPPLIP